MTSKRDNKANAAVQVFVPIPTRNRFRAACDLANRDMGEVLEEFMEQYADKAGIPKGEKPKR